MRKDNNKLNNFVKITESQDLIKFLNDSKNRLKNSKCLHHYTTIDNFFKMIKNNCVHLVNAKSMNDQLEYINGDKEIWEKTFFSSFMAGEKESIGMWSMYAQPWEKGVKISIPTSVIQGWVENTKYLYKVENYENTDTKIILDKGSCSLGLSSVVYTNVDSLHEGEQVKLQWSNKSNNTIKVTNQFKELTGYIKDMAWSYEKEVRIKTEINNISNIDRVSIPLTEEVINKMIITASPLFKGDLIEKIEKEIKRSFKSESSLFKKKLNIKTICDTCKLKTS